MSNPFGTFRIPNRRSASKVDAGDNGCLEEHELAPALQRFGELLDRRLRRGVHTTEDAVRYTFFVALIQALGLQPEDLIPEQDHGNIAGAKIDTCMPAFAKWGYSIESKYHR